MKLVRLLESVYIKDLKVGDLPDDVQTDIGQFVDAWKSDKVVQYGMVADELVSKADQCNLDTAKKNVRDHDEQECFDEVRDKVKAGHKFILLLNDKIVDGHHFLAKALRGGVTSSLLVIDLTSIRHQ